MARLASAGYGVAMLPTAILRAELELGTLRLLRTAPTVGSHDLLLARHTSVSEVIVSTVRDTAAQLVRASDLIQT